MTLVEITELPTETPLSCPGCGCRLDPDEHAELVCDDQVWCFGCHRYPPEVTATRKFAELQDWSAAICAAFGQKPVIMLENPEATSNWRLYWQNDSCLLAESYHNHRAIVLYPPGQRLTTLCHELAHIFTRQEHTRTWALTFARLVAWVREHL